MRIPQVNVTGAFFKVDGTPTSLGQILVRAVNALNDRTGGILGTYLPLPLSLVADLPTTAPHGGFVLCTDEAGGEVPVFKDNAGAWRRVTDRAIAS